MRCQHDKTVEAESDARCLRHARQCRKEILVDWIAFAINAFLLGHLGLETPALLLGIGQFAKPIRELHAAEIKFETFSHTRVMARGASERRERSGIFVKNGRRADPELGLNPFHQYTAENIRPSIVCREFYARSRRFLGQG